MSLPSFINPDIRILVVDDYLLTRDMVRSILKGLGFSNVASAESAQMALNRLKDEEFDLVICDWNMPGLTGLQLLQEVRREKRYRNLPFIMLTAEAYRENVVEAMRAGVSEYIAKPFTAQTLADKIAAALQQKRS